MVRILARGNIKKLRSSWGEGNHASCAGYDKGDHDVYYNMSLLSVSQGTGGVFLR